MPTDTAKNLGLGAVIAGLVMPTCLALFLAVESAKSNSPRPDAASGGIGLGGYVLLAGMCVGPIAAIVLSCCSLNATAGKIGLALGILGLVVVVAIGGIVGVLVALGAVQLP